MTSLAVVTPSYAPDAELCARLHHSVLQWTPQDVVHYLVVPRRDRHLFAGLAGPRCVLWTVDEILPRRYVRVPGVNAWVDVRRPWPPVRGWVVQQVVKMAAALRVDAGCVIVIDSDVELIGELTAEDVTTEGGTRLYRLPDAVSAAMPEHVAWHRAAERLLGLPPRPLPLPDYISPLNVWDPDLLRSLSDRIEDVSGRPWEDAVSACLRVSEFILYGVYADEVARVPPSLATTTLGCHTYWDEVPLDLASGRRFVGDAPPDTRAITISAKSGTPVHVRDEILTFATRPQPSLRTPARPPDRSPEK